WRIFSAKHPGLEVRHVRVASSEREVPAWDQPLLATASEGVATLVCQKQAGVLKLLFTARPEPGFDECLQLGPSFQRSPGPQDLVPSLAPRERRLEELAASAREVVSILQSDEGGRFLTSVTRYSIAEVDSASTPTELEGTVWLTVREVADLIQ